MTKEQFDKWCESVPLTQEDVDKMNEERMQYAIENDLVYSPYIPLYCEYGPVLRPSKAK